MELIEGIRALLFGFGSEEAYNFVYRYLYSLQAV